MLRLDRPASGLQRRYHEKAPATRGSWRRPATRNFHLRPRASSGPAPAAAPRQLRPRASSGDGDWIALVVLGIICAGYLLGASALLRRPGVASPGLRGGVFTVLAGLGMSGFTAADQVTFIPDPWQQWVRVIAVPVAIGAAGTLRARDPAAERHIARLAALSAGLLQLLYASVAVAILGGGGTPDQDGGFTVRGTVSDRLSSDIVALVVSVSRAGRAPLPEVTGLVSPGARA